MVQHHLQQVAERAEQRLLDRRGLGQVGRAAAAGARCLAAGQRPALLGQGRARRQQRQVGGQPRGEAQHRLRRAFQQQPRGRASRRPRRAACRPAAPPATGALRRRQRDQAAPAAEGGNRHHRPVMQVRRLDRFGRAAGQPGPRRFRHGPQHPPQPARRLFQRQAAAAPARPRRCPARSAPPPCCGTGRHGGRRWRGGGRAAPRHRGRARIPGPAAARPARHPIGLPAGIQRRRYRGRSADRLRRIRREQVPRLDESIKSSTPGSSRCQGLAMLNSTRAPVG